MLVGLGAVDAVHLLGHGVDPPALVAPGEAGVGPAAGHVVEHGDVLGHPDGVLGRQHDAELPHSDPLGLHPHEEVEQDGVVGYLEALDVEVVLGERDRVVPELVREPGLLAHLAQHALVQIGAQPGHALLDVGPASDRGQVEERDLHATGDHRADPVCRAACDRGGRRA